ncbi:DNA-directed RNA polymerases IV and V subunit 2 [Lactuca sativa]|uniref:DNA-directed RNA polymerases IV and V subunit 2 n=1 Tax=Lactuca sativa TaxID=4236 RepID=UPI000CBD78C2|nr:DNA-directed RNA polymerases IV and V subunit 2 [Lactuca sativa]
MMDDAPSVKDFDESFLKKFCKKASTSFFKHYGLISNQINSYNDFTNVGIQNVFDSIGDIMVEPGFDPSKKRDNEWRYASIKFGKVTLERPRYIAAEGGDESVVYLPRHARLQNMTYSSRMQVQFKLQVYTQELARSDKFKTGKETYVEKKILENEPEEGELYWEDSGDDQF